MLGFRLNTIAKKLPLALLASALVVSAGVGIGSYIIGSQVVGDLPRQKLTTLAYERSKQVQDFLVSIRNDLSTTANSQSTSQAVRDFANAWLQMRELQTETLQKIFITDNPNPPEQRALLDKGPTNVNYSVSHTRYNPSYRKQAEAHGYGDLYLIDATGNVVYSLNKLDEFAINLIAPESPLASSGLTQAFQAAAAQTAPGEPPVFTDFCALRRGPGHRCLHGGSHLQSRRPPARGSRVPAFAAADRHGRRRSCRPGRDGRGRRRRRRSPVANGVRVHPDR